MEKLVHEINERLDTLDFEKLWSGFQKCDFAIYDDENVYFSDKVIPVDNRFAGDTSIEYEGQYIAIWKVGESDRENIDVLTASIVHEMFHVHQNMHNEKRFFDDMEGLKYPYNIENYRLRYYEQILLVSALKEKELDKKAQLFGKFIKTRLNRGKIILGNINYEKAIETVEGCAEFISLKALKSLCYKEYEKRIQAICSMLCKVDNNTLYTRKMAYFSGVMMCLITEELGKNIIDNVGESKLYIFDIIQNMGFEDESAIEVNTVANYEKFKQLLDKYLENIKQSIDSILTNENVKEEEGKFLVCGYDPMNMARYKNMVLHKNFVFLYDGSEKRFLNGPVVTFSECENYRECKKIASLQKYRG